MTDIVNQAKELATKVHQGQFRWDGKTPYITHPEAVADQLTTPEEKAVGYLHDVVEDTKVTLDDLRETGFPEEVVLGVGAMTNPKRENTYLEYIKTVMNNPIATNVKIADIRHNMSTMPDSKKRQSLYAKYELALYILERHAILRPEPIEPIEAKKPLIIEAEATFATGQPTPNGDVFSEHAMEQLQNYYNTKNVSIYDDSGSTKVAETIKGSAKIVDNKLVSQMRVVRKETEDLIINYVKEGLMDLNDFDLDVSYRVDEYEELSGGTKVIKSGRAIATSVSPRPSKPEDNDDQHRTSGET